MTTNRESGPPAVGVSADPSAETPTTTGRLAPAADVRNDSADMPHGSADARNDLADARNDLAGAHTDPADDDTDDHLPLEEATAYGVEGYDPDDPWNAVLCVESERAVTVLPLTPKSLGELVSSLAEVQDAQRFALGADGLGGVEGVGSVEGVEGRRGERRAFRNVADAARFATGSAPVARLWQTSMRGRLIIIAGAVLFVVIGIVASVFAR